MVKESKINIAPVKIGRIKLKVIGTSPYMPEPMDMAVVERYNAKKSNQIYIKDDIPEEEKVKYKYYYTNEGKKAVPTRAFYKAMIRASSYLIDKTDGGMRNVKEGVNIVGNMLPLKYSNEEVLTHWGRTAGRTRSPRKIMRNSFNDWKAELTIEYNQTQLSPEQIVNILNWAGFHIGVGAFRKENTGNFGAFYVKM